MSAMPAIPIPDEASLSQTYKTRACAAESATSGMAAITIPRRTPQPERRPDRNSLSAASATPMCISCTMILPPSCRPRTLRARTRDRWTP